MSRPLAGVHVPGPPMIRVAASLLIAATVAACAGAHTTVARTGHANQQLVLAQCMRAHGVSGWADPTFPPSGGVSGGGLSNGALGNAPATQRAAMTCNRIVGL